MHLSLPQAKIESVGLIIANCRQTVYNSSTGLNAPHNNEKSSLAVHSIAHPVTFVTWLTACDEIGCTLQKSWSLPCGSPLRDIVRRSKLPSDTSNKHATKAYYKLQSTTAAVHRSNTFRNTLIPAFQVTHGITSRYRRQQYRTTALSLHDIGTSRRFLQCQWPKRSTLH